MAALPDTLDFDPLASGGFLGAFIRCLDYENRHQLTARGSGGSGGSGRRGGSGRGSSRLPSGRRRQSVAASAFVREVKEALRWVARNAAASARAKRRAAERAAAEAAYQTRVFQRPVATAARARTRAAEREARQAERYAARNRRLLTQFQTRPSRRTPYQRRVVSSVIRQIERGEGAGNLTDAQAIEQAKLRLRQVFPNSENYDNSFARLDYLPELARTLLTLSDRALRALVRANPKNDPAIFNKELARLTNQEPLSLPVLVTGNPLFYHGDASRVQYGI
jgi:hypothetical protein